MTRTRQTLVPALLCLCLGPAAGAGQAPSFPARDQTQLTQASRTGHGIFRVFYQRDSVYLALAPAQLDRDFLLVTQVSRGIGELGLDGGASVRSDLIRFHEEGDRIELWVVNPHLVADPGTPMARTVAYSFGHSIAFSFPVAATRDDGERLVDFTPFLLSDWADVASVLRAGASKRKVTADIDLDESRSSLQELRLFPHNLEAEVRLTFESSRDLGLETVSDYRWIPVGIHYSLLALPATPMQPRPADDRVGYFVSAMKDFSRDTAQGFFVRRINRWRLEKQRPGSAVSEPVTPITFYLDRTIPTEWRPYVRAGILEWNRAFLEAGFRDAIRVLDPPEDASWSAADARYSTVRWTATHRSAYAIGPTSVDPRTGEILNADILISAAWIQRWRGQSGQYVSPLVALRSVFQEDSLLATAADARVCRYTRGLGGGGGLARAVLEARGDIPVGGEVSRAYIGQALKALVMHEVGHTLGLRHNFRGSAGSTRNQLADRRYTASHGFGVSVMDYNPPALARDPRQQGDYYPPTIGSYDRWAIQYGYIEPSQGRPATDRRPDESPQPIPEITREELDELQAIASQAADPAHLYGSDEDAGFGIVGLDPTISRYDQTNDPLGWARDRVGLIDWLLDSLDTRMVGPGEGYDRLRGVFTDLLNDRWYALLISTKYLGGATTARDHRGDPGARPAFVNVPADQQRAALAFLADAGFGEQAYRFRPQLLNQLTPARWTHWGATAGGGERIDFPLHDYARNQQASLLGQLLDPGVLSRIRDAELRTPTPDQTLGLPDLFQTLTDAIWAEVAETPRTRVPRAQNISSVRRDLQRLHLNALVRMTVSPAAGTPEDARALARASLADLGALLDRALAAPKLDPYTRAHLKDSRDRIGQALNAEMIQAIVPSR